ncbi:MAG: C-type lectin domain-containing protein [Synergistaceae bacterium]|nr:C-type lectin domain-containing protein [Synergistaceae bacterium]
MTVRKFGTIKSLLHFDYPYFNEPNDGLGDEVSGETWTRIGNTKLAGNEIPYDVQGTPKFGYRCAYFPDVNSSIRGTNTSGIFNLSPSGSYEIEAFVKYSGAGNIFTIGDLILSVNSSRQLTLLSETSTTTLTANIWQHILLRLKKGTAKVFLDGVEILSASMTSSVSPSTVTLGGFIGYMDEFCFKHSAGTGAPIVPTQPYSGKLNVNKVGGFGTGSDGDVTISANSQINSYGIINSLSGDYYNGHTFKVFTTSSKTWAQAKAACEEIGGHLVTITSAEKQAFIETLIDSNVSYWIGAYGNNTNLEYQWVTGEEWDYDNWDEGQPDIVSMYVYIWANHNFKWDDVGNNASMSSFICEWDYIPDAKTFSVSSWSNGIYTPAVGSEVMIHITAPRSTTGAEYPFVGFYAFRKIKSLNGTVITLNKEIDATNGDDFTLSNSLLEDYYVQVITIPNFASLTLNAGITITPLTWGTSTGGGIVAFRCLGDCTINGSILTHGYGAARYDLQQMTHSKLIDRFLFNKGGGIYITCGGTFTASSSARIGASWDGSAGAGRGVTRSRGTDGGAGYGGGGGSDSDTNTIGGNGGVGGGGGATDGSGGTSAAQVYFANAGNGPSTGGWGGDRTQTQIGINEDAKGGTQGVTIGGSGGLTPDDLTFGGGGALGNAGSWSCSGACLILLAETLNVNASSISTGGEGGRYTSSWQRSGGGGTGMCYIACKEQVSE